MASPQQEWHRRTARRTAVPGGGGGSDNSTGHTVASASKVVPKSATTATDAHVKPRATALPPSRWRELRQSVRIKATREPSERRVADARIADLCDADREKVAKLIRRIVEIGTLQEETEADFARQRSALDAEIVDLRAQVKRDAHELDDLSDTLQSTLHKLRDFQARVAVLEESNDAATHSRNDSEHTIDLLHLEVEKLRALVRRQADETTAREQATQLQYQHEIERLQQQLQHANDALLTERRERIDDQQRALEQRLAQSQAQCASHVHDSRSDRAICEDEQHHAQANATHTSDDVPSVPLPPPPAAANTTAGVRSLSPNDVSSFLNTSIELPERIKDILDDWKQRMQDALAQSVDAVATAAPQNDARDAMHRIATSDDSNVHPTQQQQQHDLQQQHQQQRRVRHRDAVPTVTRVPFDAELQLSLASEYDDDSDRNSNSECNSDSDSAREHQQQRRRHQRSRDDVHEHDTDDSQSLRRINRTNDNCTIQVSRPHRRRESLDPHQHQQQQQQSDRIRNRSAQTQTHPQVRLRRERDNDDYRSNEARRNRRNAFDDDANDNDAAMPTDPFVRDVLSFVLLPDFGGGGRCAGRSAGSFGSLYDHALFDVVDALEGANATTEPGIDRTINTGAHDVVSPSNRLQHHHMSDSSSTNDQLCRSSTPQRQVESNSHRNASDTSPASARLESLLRGIEVRERKLARFLNDRVVDNDEQLQQQQSREGDNNVSTATAVGTCATVDADVELFNAVRDEYAAALFASRDRHLDAAVVPTTLDQHCNPTAFMADRSLGPPLSPHDLSVRDAIEHDMAELLRQDDALAHLQP